MKKLRVIDFSKETEFEANGTKYYVEKGLSFDRYLFYLMAQIECGYDVSFKSMFDNIKKAYELVNKMKLIEGGVILHNILHGITKIEQRRIPVLTMCALFINTADEDRRVITDEMVDKKIKDWTAEGLEINSFFQLAISSMANFSRAWEEISLTISADLKKAEQ
jgi:hypothetical protein